MIKINGLTKSYRKKRVVDELSFEIREGELFALAQALLGDPQILILDEPCAGLDAMGRLEMLELIRRFKEQGKTIIMNSHILSDIEKVCDGGIIMKKGKKVNAFQKSDLTKERTLEKLFVESVGGTLEEGGEAVCG